MAATIDPASQPDMVVQPTHHDDGGSPRQILPQPRQPRRRATDLRHRVLRVAGRIAAGVMLVALAWIAYGYWLELQPPPAPEISGVIEAEDVVVGAEVSGRIMTLLVAEGQRVAAGAELGRLDDSRLKLQMSMVDVATQRQLALDADKYVLRAPRAGQVMRVVARAGELTMPGQPVLVIADLGEVKANLYVPVRHLSSVRVGQTLALTTDPFPGRIFSGTVTSINPKAEYTPRNVQSPRDRLNLVFGVTVRIDNRDGALLPGLPVQATIAADAAN
jgi:multidrug efflux pump subunit AcrA (membrane-fusion protein)